MQFGITHIPIKTMKSKQYEKLKMNFAKGDIIITPVLFFITLPEKYRHGNNYYQRKNKNR